MKKRLTAIFTAIVTAILLTVPAGCSSSATKGKDETAAAEPVALMVSAAASMTEAMEKIGALYEESNAGVDVVLNFGSSGSLQKQIEQGAPVDVFLSASKGKMTALLDQGLLLDDTMVDLLENEIVLIAPEGSNLTGFDALTGDSVVYFAMGEPESVPAGKYAKEVLASLELYDTLAEKTVIGKDVKEVLSWVETGNAEAGMVYHTDALVSDKVTVIAAAPDGSHSLIIYPAAIIKDSGHTWLAADFLAFLEEEDAKAIFLEYGFTTK